MSLYSAVSGFSPDNPSSDQGAVETDVLNYWLRHKVEGHALSAFAALQPRDIRDVKDAIWLFGGVILGLLCRQRAISRRLGRSRCRISGDGAPGSWGGHAVYVVAYDARGLTCITWGRLKRMSWNFWAAYCDEAYGLLAKDWFEASGKAPSGFDAGPWPVTWRRCVKRRETFFSFSGRHS